METADLWEHIERGDHLANVGFRGIGSERGFFEGRATVTISEVANALEILESLPGVDVLETDSLVPQAHIRIADLTTLQAVRGMPFIEYVEPNALPSGLAEAVCGWGDPWTGQSSIVAPGDLIPPSYTSSYSRIPLAWTWSIGQDVTIGVTDTGVSVDQPYLGNLFTESNLAPNRWSHHESAEVERNADDECGHGTRMASVAMAPRNGKDMVGVAHGANLVAIHIDDNFALVNAWQAKDGIRLAMTRPQNSDVKRRIVVMGWWAGTGSSTISSEIDLHYYRDIGPPLFIAAAGTSPNCWSNPWEIWPVVFPANHPRVMAVSAVKEDLTLDCRTHYGSEVEVVGFRMNMALGHDVTHGVRDMRYASSATGFVAGIAALVWAQNPTWHGDHVRHRLRNSGHLAVKSPDIGWGVVDAWKAVGGFHVLSVSGPDLVEPGSNNQYTAQPHGGQGPFLYQWDSGQTSQTIWWQAPQQEGDYFVGVTVTDTYDGHQINGGIAVRVRQDQQCQDCWIDP